MNKTIKYGTSGFRTHNSEIKEIAIKIGKAIASLTYYKKESFGIMITASHNHHQDNGVKIMNCQGNMVSKDIETYLENFINNFDMNHQKQTIPFIPCIHVQDDGVTILRFKR